MKLLAIDTSSIACSVALRCGENLVERHAERPREHTRLLLPMIAEVLAEAGTPVAGLDAIVLGNGPGSFIGMRIGASVAQGLAHGAGLGIVPVSSLAAVAAEVFASGECGRVAVAQDAHMDEVYFGLFERGENDVPIAAGEESLQGQGVVESLRGGSAVAAGAGWDRYPALLAANRAWLGAVSDCRQPRARYLLATAAARADASIAPRLLEPAYLRQRVAARPCKRP